MKYPYSKAGESAKRDGKRKKEEKKLGGDCAIDIVLKLGYDLSNFRGQSRAVESVRLNIVLRKTSDKGYFIITNHRVAHQDDAPENRNEAAIPLMLRMELLIEDQSLTKIGFCDVRCVYLNLEYSISNNMLTTAICTENERNFFFSTSDHDLRSVTFFVNSLSEQLFTQVFD